MTSSASPSSIVGDCGYDTFPDFPADPSCGYSTGTAFPPAANASCKNGAVWGHPDLLLADSTITMTSIENC